MTMITVTYVLQYDREYHSYSLCIVYNSHACSMNMQACYYHSVVERIVHGRGVKQQQQCTLISVSPLSLSFSLSLTHTHTHTHTLEHTNQLP